MSRDEQDAIQFLLSVVIIGVGVMAGICTLLFHLLT
jgi:hypothetical protein